MQLTLNWTDPLTWGCLLALTILLAVQGWLIARNASLSPARKSVRLGLNGLLWLVLLAYLLQPRWPVAKPDTQVLLVGDEVPASVARAFARRCTRLVQAGRPPCPFCGGPLDPTGHICPRANGYRRPLFS